MSLTPDMIPAWELREHLKDRDVEITRLKAEVERLRGALEAWDYAVRVNLTMEGPSYAGVSSEYSKKAWKLTRAALTNNFNTKENEHG